jgi:hypothetical protein
MGGATIYFPPPPPSYTEGYKVGHFATMYLLSSIKTMDYSPVGGMI